MDFWDWMNKKVDRTFDRIDKRMDDTFNKIEKIFDSDYIDIRTDAQKEESKARDEAKLRSILNPIRDSRTETEKREDKKDFKDYVSSKNDLLGDVVDVINNVEDTINNAISGSNIFKALSNELKKDATNLSEGDHLYVQRIGYTHHGIYIGNGNVIHYLMESVQMSSLDEFKQGATLLKMSLDESPTCYSNEKIVSRAHLRYCEDKYNLIINNCEHFCRWCRFGS